MTHFLARWLVVLVLAAQPAWHASTAWADDLPAAQAQAIQRLVIDHLDALAVGDAQRLFEQITPEVREAFASSGDFLAMLQTLYPMVSRPSRIGFSPAQASRDGAMQWVEVTDEDNVRWLVLFLMHRQPDAAWRIGGCVVFENPWLAT